MVGKKSFKVRVPFRKLPFLVSRVDNNAVMYYFHVEGLKENFRKAEIKLR